jgi:hypothetical protein
MACIPPFYTGSTYHKPQVNGAIEAFEALNLATINVVSLAMVGVGATLYAFDINSVEDVQRRVRGALDADRTGSGTGSGSLATNATDKELEEDLEEWIAKVLDRKDFVEQLKKLREDRGQEGTTNEKGKDQ